MIKAIRRFARMLLDLVYMQKGLDLLRKHQSQLPMPVEDIVDSMEQYPSLSLYHLLGAMQVRPELIALLSELEKRKPEIALEIGTASGGSLFCWSHFVKELLITVDLPGGPYGGGYEITRQKLYKAFEGNSPKLKIEFVRGRSVEQKSIDQVSRILNGNKLDYFFIDGDHTLKGVFADLKAYAPFLAENAMVVLHDIDAQEPDNDCRVNLLWNEIKNQWNGIEIMDKGKSTEVRMGIGWFLWKLDYMEQLSALEDRISSL